MKTILKNVMYALAGIAAVLVLCGVIWLKMAINEGLAHPPQAAQIR